MISKKLGSFNSHMGYKILRSRSPKEFFIALAIGLLLKSNTVVASQITVVLIVCSKVCPDADQRKHQSSASLTFVKEILATSGFPSHRATNAENVSIWWRHVNGWSVAQYRMHVNIAVFPLTHNRCEVVISWWSPLLPKISIYATKCESIVEKSGIFIHLHSKYCINLSCKKNLTISWVQIAARW